MSKILTVYYSRRGENYWAGSIKNLKKGNTEIVAGMIREAVGGEIFEVDTAQAYSPDYTTCTQQAQKELRANVRPALKRNMASLDGYDTIFVGYPNWWGTMPMVMFTFLEQFALAGKRIIPFCTNEGSGMGSSESDLKKLCTGAKVEKGLAIRGSQAADSGAQVAAWAKRMVR